MRPSRSHLPLILAALVALRALVPVGYMLALPGGADAAGLGLTLCPLQNTTLKLDALGSVAQVSAAVDHRHFHHRSSSSSDQVTVDASSGCQAWLNTAALVPTDDLTWSGVPQPDRLDELTGERWLPTPQASQRPPVRAPPA